VNKDEENKIQKMIKEEIAKTDNQKKRMKEVERIGYNYQRRDYTREELIEKYGQDWIDMVDESTSDGWLKMFNDYKHSYYVENFDKIPMGLEKKVALGWFMHFFNWNDMDAFQVSVDETSFHGNWLDVPFPNATEINLMGNDTRKLKDPCYNWYELFIIIDDLMWNQGRVFDIGITSINIKRLSQDRQVIEVWWSS
jgi:hypothetical protein